MTLDSGKPIAIPSMVPCDRDPIAATRPRAVVGTRSRVRRILSIASPSLVRARHARLLIYSSDLATQAQRDRGEVTRWKER
jgi:hypothetical protein